MSAWERRVKMVSWTAAAHRRYLAEMVESHAKVAHHSGQRITLDGEFDHRVKVDSLPDFCVAPYDAELASKLMRPLQAEEAAPEEDPAEGEDHEADDSSSSSGAEDASIYSSISPLSPSAGEEATAASAGEEATAGSATSSSSEASSKSSEAAPPSAAC